jgi:DNA-binding transcriptional LysR family regulator
MKRYFTMTGNAFDRLKRMAVFAEIVGSGSMTSAARRLAMSPSAVSQQLRQLEHELGLTLMLRSTRKLALTEAGQRFYAGCSAMIDAARSAEQSLAQLRDEPEGELRLAAPIGFAALIADALAPLAPPAPADHAPAARRCTDRSDRPAYRSGIASRRTA